jgi:RES domain-containing protein
VLYLALTEATALLEIARQYDAHDWPPKNRRFTKLRVELQSVIDCSDATRLGLSPDDLCQDPDDLDSDPCHAAAWETPRRIAEAAFNHSAEGILVPSASRRGLNLIVFPENLRPTSTIEASSEFYEPRWSRTQTDA